MLKQSCWWLRTRPVTSTHSALPLLLTAEGWPRRSRQRVRKGIQLLIIWCDYWLWESVRGMKATQKDRMSDGAVHSWTFFSLSRSSRSLGNSWVTEVSETASGWCMGISNPCRSELSTALTHHMYSIYITAEGASAKHLRGATFCYTYSCNRHRNNQIRLTQLIDWPFCNHCSQLGHSWVTAVLCPHDFLQGKKHLKYLRIFRICSPGCFSQQFTPFWPFFHIC